jgi:hypothetical protein
MSTRELIRGAIGLTLYLFAGPALLYIPQCCCLDSLDD